MRLPSSKVLDALEATVRLGKVTLAAEELGLTQAAVSHRIRDLEDELEQPLFIRHGRRLEATPHAVALADAARASRQILESAIQSIRTKPALSSLTISMLPALASKWLAPRLAEVLMDVQETDLRVTASRSFVDFARDGVDAAVRYGLGQWPGVRTLPLTGEYVTPVMSPTFASRNDLSNPSELLHCALLECDNPEGWGDWLALVGAEDKTTATPVVFDEDATMIEAAIAGHGVALGRSVLVAHDIRTGRLVAPFGETLASKFSYWFVQDAHVPESPSARDFYLWAKTALTRDAQVYITA